MNIAYIRVSTTDQSPARQYELLKSYNIERYFEEKKSGKNADRPELKTMLDFARHGDTVYIESISRLARNTKDFLSIVEELTAKGVIVISLKESIDTGTPQGQFMLTVFAALAELERANIRQRQREGIDLALKEKRPYGRPAAQITAEYKKAFSLWKAGEITAVKAMQLSNTKPNTFYKLAKKMPQVY